MASEHVDPLRDLPPAFAATRVAMQRVAAHVLARRRHALVGKIGLRSTPGGIGTPAAGPEHEVVRTSGSWLLRERTGATASTEALDLATATLAQAAALAEVDLGAELSVGHDTPEVGDPSAPLGIDPASASALAGWYAFGWAVLDGAAAAGGPDAAPSVVQLWPEHFDAGCDLAVRPGRRTNLGASPGDGFQAEPYLYVGPWDGARPGDPAYWNAPFGAVLGYAELRRAEDPTARALDFVRTGLDHLTLDSTG
jgi:hypothetical protein